MCFTLLQVDAQCRATMGQAEEGLRNAAEEERPAALAALAEAAASIARLREHTATVVLGGLAAPLHHLHVHGVVHKDLKLDNVMMTPDGCVKLLDLGLAAPSLESGGSAYLRGGTVEYMTPASLLDAHYGQMPGQDW